MLDWIQSYFTSATTATTANQNKTVYITNRPPLYLQHQGHSRTVVGIELLKSGKRNLIMFDPGRRMLRSYKSKSGGAPVYNEQEDEEVDENNEEQQVTEEDEEEEEIDILNEKEETTQKKKSLKKRFLSKIQHKPLPTSLLRPFRVDDKTIAKHKQYSILVLGQVEYQNGKMNYDSKKSYLLNEQEREVMKNVTSLSVL